MMIKANYIDIIGRKIFPAQVEIVDHHIASITPIDEECTQYILPGFVDAHIHIESSMLLPSAFAPIAVTHGTVGTVSDPHEIANVCGEEGVLFMLKDAAQVPFKFNFGAPSCVPATSFETAGAVLSASDVDRLLARDDIKYLSEVMNYPGVLAEDPSLMAMIASAKKYGKVIDGHAPGLMGADAIAYIQKGISTDHECFTQEEALHKLKHGMKVLIREGSAAKNFDALIPLLDEYYEHMMFCCDDKHPDELLLHHINHHVKKAIAYGCDIYKVLQCACINPVKHYQLDIGLLQIGDPADFILMNNLQDFEIEATYINGEPVYRKGEPVMMRGKSALINQFNCSEKSAENFSVPPSMQPIIQVLDGQLITKALHTDSIPSIDLEKDILQISVINRYHDAPVASAYIYGVGIKKGAIASTVAHDSHNIIVVGVDHESMALAANEIIRCKGGICATDGKHTVTLPLPIAGIMSDQDIHTVAEKYKECDAFAKKLGSTLAAPFMSLSFMALLVIPEIKLSDKGLWDGKAWKFITSC